MATWKDLPNFNTLGEIDDRIQTVIALGQDGTYTDWPIHKDMAAKDELYFPSHKTKFRGTFDVDKPSEHTVKFEKLADRIFLESSSK